MVRAVLTVILALGIWLPAAAQEGRRAAIEHVVQGQIQAFLLDDFAAAFAFASPGIQRYFGNSENFGAMVRQGYPMVWRPADIRYLDLRERGGRLFQDVMIRDAAGNFHMLEYQMTQGENGWQINGVRLIEPPGAGA